MSNTLLLRSSEFGCLCPYFMDTISSETTPDIITRIEWRKKFQVLINFTLYGKMRGINIDYPTLTRKWAALTSKLKNVPSLRNEIGSLSHICSKFDAIKCVASPIEYDCGWFTVNGYIDCINEKETGYDIVVFDLGDYLAKDISLRRDFSEFVAIGFLQDFFEKTFDIVIYNLTSEDTYRIKNAGDAIGSRSVLYQDKELFQPHCFECEVNEICERRSKSHNRRRSR